MHSGSRAELPEQSVSLLDGPVVLNASTGVLTIALSAIGCTANGLSPKGLAYCQC